MDHIINPLLSLSFWAFEKLARSSLREGRRSSNKMPVNIFSCHRRRARRKASSPSPSPRWSPGKYSLPFWFYNMELWTPGLWVFQRGHTHPKASAISSEDTTMLSTRSSHRSSSASPATGLLWWCYQTSVENSTPALLLSPALLPNMLYL